MKMIIGKLRIAALASLTLFFILMFLGSANPGRFYFDYVQSVLIFLSLVLFAIILLLQVYRFYISYYMNDEAEENHPD